MESTVHNAALALCESRDFVWHQRFELVPGVHTPGVNDINWLLEASKFPTNLAGKSVLDIGTTNGAMAFEAERRGSTDVTAVDISDENHYGFRKIANLLDSNVKFHQASIYDLPSVLNRTYDVVVFWGVLYHLRHPLLALDSLRAICGDLCYLESAIYSPTTEMNDHVAKFHRLDDLAGDGTNWWSPTVETTEDWCRSAGFTFELQQLMPPTRPERCLALLKVVPGTPEYLTLSYERPLQVKVL
ncbi:MAG: methyltransferase domain-containing protein [Acidobacteria bacterium]|nr:methyltransferase domain-containing protein [Acidobacteriota bacterium]